MKIKEFKKYIISSKKYIIGFILGLSLIGTFTYAADPGSIGALFTNITGTWTLKEEAFRNDSISNDKLKSGIDGNKIVNGTLSKSKLDTTLTNDIDSKLGNGSNATLQNLTVNNNISVNNDLGVTRNMWVGGDIGTKNLVVNNNTWLNGNTNIAGNMDAKTISINGVPLEKTLKVVDESWYNVLNVPKQWGEGYKGTVAYNFWTGTYDPLFIWTVPTGKYIAKIRLYAYNSEGYSVDDTGVCGVFVNNKLGFLATRSANVSMLNTTLTLVNDYWGIRNAHFQAIGNHTDYNNCGWGDIPTTYFDINALSGLKSTSKTGGCNNKMYNVNPGVKYLEGGDKINMELFVDDFGGGNTFIGCRMDVQYGVLSY